VSGDPRVEIAEGTAFEVLLGAAAVADANWRDVFSSGTTTYERALTMLGPDFVAQVTDLGRFGWLNLIALIISADPPWDLDQLIDVVRHSAPGDLHYVTVGGDRRQFLDVIEESVVRAAVAGDQHAKDQLTAALASDSHVLEGTPWLVAAHSGAVQARILDVLEAWRETLLPAATEEAAAASQHENAEAARARLAQRSGREFLTEAIGGLVYEPAGLDRLLAVPTAAVAPVVVVVDGRDATVILHPPLDDDARPDANVRLSELGRAVGDRTRIRLLALLRGGERTAIDLAGALEAPRTTLLHHLAILRAAGLVHVQVTPGGATVYRIRTEGFQALAAAAADFIPTE
jgi:DNA-binding transcriptional ArsR family regulator